MKSAKHLILAAIIVSLCPTIALTAEGNEKKAGSDRLEEVVVTAQKREQSLLDVSMAVSAFSAARLDKSGITNVLELANFTPGLSVSPNRGGGGNVYMRGIGTSLLGAGADPNVAIYHDGVYVPRHSVAFQEFMNVERVEVLRGPQGTLYGRNATGGAINIIHKKPTEEFTFSARADAGNFDKQGFAASVGGAIVDEKLFGSVTYSRQKRENYSYNAFLNETLDGNDSNFASGVLVYQPTENFEAVLRVTKAEDDAAGNLAFKNILRGPTTLTADPEPADPFTVLNNYSPGGRNNTDSEGYGLELSWDIGEATIKSTTGYRLIKVSSSFDTDGTNLNIGFNIFKEDSEMLSQELQLTTPISNRVQLVSGLYWYEEDTTSDLDFQYENDAVVCAGLGQSVPCVATTTFVSWNQTDAYALYSELTWSVTDRFRTIIGLRYSDEDKAFSSTGGLENFLLDIGPFIGVPVTVPFDASGLGSTTERNGWSDTTGRLVGEFDISDDVMLYLSYAEGFKSGGFNSSDVGIVVSPFLTGTGSQGSFGPEFITSIEAGIKGSVLDNRVRGALTVFDYDYEDLQVRFVDSVNATLPIRNAATASVFGIEFEGEALISDQFKLDWALTSLDSQYDSFPDAQDAVTGTPLDLSGQTLLRTPDFKASVGGEYTIDLQSGSLLLRGEWLSQSKQRFADSQEPFLTGGDYSYFNARITWLSPEGRWNVSAWGQNINDELYESTKAFNNQQGGSAIYAPPQSYGITVGYNH